MPLPVLHHTDAVGVDDLPEKFVSFLVHREPTAHYERLRRRISGLKRRGGEPPEAGTVLVVFVDLSGLSIVVRSRPDVPGFRGISSLAALSPVFHDRALRFVRSKRSLLPEGKQNSRSKKREENHD